MSQDPWPTHDGKVEAVKWIDIEASHEGCHGNVRIFLDFLFLC